MDKIMTRTIAGMDMPVFIKKDMEDQIPSLKKQNLKHDVFAKKTIQELFPDQLLKNSLVKQFNFCSSIIAVNEGNGKFAIQKLPAMVQLSSVNAASLADVNGDGYADLVLGGNEFGFLPQFGRLDAGFGSVLLNNGKGGFDWIPPARSGLELRGQIRDIVNIPGRGKDYLLFLQNDEYPVLFEYKGKRAGKPGTFPNKAASK
jgi:hypothetical protein